MRYEALILDLDGVVYIGPDVVPHAISALNECARRGSLLSAATNNANRPATLVAGHLQQLGLDIETRFVMTSAQAAALHMSRLFDPGSAILAVGGDGVAESLVAEGLRPLRADQDLARSSEIAEEVVAVVVGYGPNVAWFDLATAHWAIERGKPWFATNTDPTVPLPFGRAPGNGAMVGLLQNSTGVAPTVIGKPQPALFDALASQLGTRDCLVIGDRLDTDIDGALAAGMDSLLVLTGVHDLSDLVAREPERWPTFVAQDLRSLAEPVVKIEALGGDAVGDVAAFHPLVHSLTSIMRDQKPSETPVAEGASPLIQLRALQHSGNRK